MEAIKTNLESIRQQAQQDQTSTEAELPRTRRKKHNAARFIMALLTFFLGCYVVINCLVIRIVAFGDVTDKAGWILTLLLVLNSAVNPLVYAFLKRDIRKEVIRFICRETRQNNTDETTTRSASRDPTCNYTLIFVDKG